ncbi:hypothetical protein AC579_9254 [Pseudocercospora musae]|uniref:Uncharacterized protein n=1 Tax=Pseudocercospora musae TaxID=113226 RepID=A0A139IH88_9PEZI|nr:hypothetical protein AC579_9254 [Pseudocercospora musae]
MARSNPVRTSASSAHQRKSVSPFQRLRSEQEFSRMEALERLFELYHLLICRRRTFTALQNQRIQAVQQYAYKHRHYEESVDDVEACLREHNNGQRRSFEESKQQLIRDGAAIVDHPNQHIAVETRIESIQHSIMEAEKDVVTSLRKLVQSFAEAYDWLQFNQPDTNAIIFEYRNGGCAPPLDPSEAN